MDFWTDVRDWLGGWPMEFVSSSSVLVFAKRAGLRCISMRRNGGNTEFAFTRPAGVERWTAAQRCERLSGFEEDTEGSFFQVQQYFYAWPDGSSSPRSWWFCRLPESMREHSDGRAEPQKSRLLLMTDEGPFGYPSAQFARPDSLADRQLSFHAFWEGFAYMSPGELSLPPNRDFRSELRVCLLPPAELSLVQEAKINAQAQQAGLDMS